VELRNAEKRNRELSEIAYLNDIRKWLQLLSNSTNYQTQCFVCVCIQNTAHMHLFGLCMEKKSGKPLDITLVCTKVSHILVYFFNIECVYLH